MKSVWAFLIQKVFPLATAEAVWRLSMLGVLALTSRHLTVGLFGAFNLGIVLYQYAVMLTDFGTRSIGARLVAIGNYPEHQIVGCVVRRRIILFCSALVLTAGYLCLTPAAGLELIWFPLAAAFFGFSHEWLLWAREQYWLFATFRSVLGGLVFVILGTIVTFGYVQDLQILGSGYAVALACGMVLSWLLSKFPVRTLMTSLRDEPIDDLQWKAIGMLGMALVANQIFHAGDMLLLGLLGNDTELGIYSAASRLVFFVYGVYFLVLQGAYPWLSRRFKTRGVESSLVYSAFLGAGGSGFVLALLLFPFAEDVIGFAFGLAVLDAGAAKVFQVLIWIVPLELIVGTWGIMATAAGMNRWALQVTSFGAVANVSLNAMLIPGYGAMGATYASLGGYAAIIIAIFMTVKKFLGLQEAS